MTPTKATILLHMTTTTMMMMIQLVLLCLVVPYASSFTTTSSRSTQYYGPSKMGMATTTTSTSLALFSRQSLLLSLLSRPQAQATTTSTTTRLWSSLSSSLSSNGDSSVSSKSSISCDVVIYGGGFGGLYTAIELDKLCRSRGWYNWNILVVDPKDEFVFLPLLYDLSVAQTATTQEVCPTYHDLLSSIPNTNIKHISDYTLHGFESIVAVDDDVEDNTTTTKRKGSLQRPPPAILKDKNTGEFIKLYSKASIIAVGATPQSILHKIPGATQYNVQPFYTKQDAIQTRALIEKLEKKKMLMMVSTKDPSISATTASVVVTNIAVIGGGFGGVELASCIQRKLDSSSSGVTTKKGRQQCQVYLISRTSRPMKNTRAENWIQQTLETIGVKIIVGTVKEIIIKKKNVEGTTYDEKEEEDPKYQIVFQNNDTDNDNGGENPEILYDAILWTAGSSPSFPIGNYISDDAKTMDDDGRDEGSSSSTISDIFETTKSGCLAVDSSLRCRLKPKQNGDADSPPKKLPIWSLGDCAEIVSESGTAAVTAATPKTAQAAMQQSTVVANNVFAYLTFTSKTNTRQFVYQDLGNMFHLGGLNAAIMGPKTSGGSSVTSSVATTGNINDMISSSASTILPPLLELTDRTLRIADQVLEQTVGGGGGRGSSSSSKDELFSGLSFSSHGLGATTTSSDTNDSDDGSGETTTNGSLLGSVSGAARRVVYAARMPTPKQQTISAVSAFVNTANELSKEILSPKSVTPKSKSTTKAATSSSSPSTSTSDGSTRSSDDKKVDDNVEEK